MLLRRASRATGPGCQVLLNCNLKNNRMENVVENERHASWLQVRRLADAKKCIRSSQLQAECNMQLVPPDHNQGCCFALGPQLSW